MAKFRKNALFGFIAVNRRLGGLCAVVVLRKGTEQESRWGGCSIGSEGGLIP